MLQIGRHSIDTNVITFGCQKTDNIKTNFQSRMTFCILFLLTVTSSTHGCKKSTHYALVVRYNIILCFTIFIHFSILMMNVIYLFENLLKILYVCHRFVKRNNSINIICSSHWCLR